PYGSFFIWLFDRRAALKVPAEADGGSDMTALHVPPMVADSLEDFRSAFSAGEGEEPISVVTAAEILN
ncbi:hypothetical protein, partial [Acinetobacter baumannii]